MATTVCPECDSDVYVADSADKGEVITCEECGTDLQVTNPDTYAVRVFDEDEDPDGDDIYADDDDEADNDSDENDDYEDDYYEDDDGDGSRY